MLTAEYKDPEHTSDDTDVIVSNLVALFQDYKGYGFLADRRIEEYGTTCVLC